MKLYTILKTILITCFISGTFSMAFGQVAPDVGVIEVVEPPNGSMLTIGTDTTVTVRIQNFGSSPISGIEVLFAIGANGQLSGTYTGSIAAGATDDFTLPTLYSITSDLSGVGFAQTNLPADTINNNDKIVTSYTYNTNSAIIKTTNTASLIDIYPNPVTDNLIIKINEPEPIYASIYNIDGKLVHSFDDCIGKSELNYNVSGLPKGTYLIKLLSKNGNKVYKFIK